MVIFKDNVGNTYKTENKFVIEQMRKSKLYTEVTEAKKELTVAEIKAKLKELNIEFDDKAKKEDLLALLPQK